MSTPNCVNSKHWRFLFKNNTTNIYTKGRALIQMYRVVPQTKGGILYRKAVNTKMYLPISGTMQGT